MTSIHRISTRARPRLLAGLATSVAPSILRQQAARAADAPDIIVLVMNDARDGDQIALPGTMARLAGGGTTFPNFFLTTPLCCPSRSSILTGLYSHHHRVFDNSDGNSGGWEGFAAHGNRGRTSGVLLQAAGYRTVALGTYLNGRPPGRGIEPGWDVGPRAAGKPKQGHGRKRHKKRNKKRNKGPGGALSDGQLAAAAAAELATASLTQPLYLHIGFSTPHVPVSPVPPYAGQFAGARVDRDPSFNEPDIADKPGYVRKLGGLSSGDQAWLDRLHQGRLECLLELDDHIATIWDALEARGRLQNSYVFLITDNGYLMGQHRFYGKIAPYDGSVRFPLYAFGPGFSPGAVDERLTGNIDIAPTLVDVAGAAAPAMDGVSLLSNHDRDAMLLESLSSSVQSMDWPGPRTAIPRYSALRTASNLYVEYQGGERELYDYAADPYETDNLLAGTPTQSASETAAELSARLADLRG